MSCRATSTATPPRPLACLKLGSRNGGASHPSHCAVRHLVGPIFRLKKPPRRPDLRVVWVRAEAPRPTKVRSKMDDSFESLRSVRGPNSAAAPCPIASVKVPSVSPREYCTRWRQHYDRGQQGVGSPNDCPHLLWTFGNRSRTNCAT